MVTGFEEGGMAGQSPGSTGSTVSSLWQTLTVGEELHTSAAYIEMLHCYQLVCKLYSNMVKGGRKRNISKFKDGHAYVPVTSSNQQPSMATVSRDNLPDENQEKSSKYLRLDAELFEDVVKTSKSKTHYIEDSHGCRVDSNMLLRPRPFKQTKLESYTSGECDTTERAEMDTYRILHMRKTEQLWNSAIEGHREWDNACHGDLIWDEESEIHWGICWKERLLCKTCDYSSQHHELYETVKTGKKGRPAGAPNIRLQVGLSHTMISNTAFQRILATTSIPPPSYVGMQKAANKVGEAIVTLNKDDMRRQREKLKNLNRIKGLPAAAGIRVEADARYNNKLGSGAGRTPFQPATQVTSTIVENETPKKRVIGLFTGNKLCRSRFHKQGKPHLCTANIEEEHTIGDEGLWAQRAVQEMAAGEEEPLLISYATTDGDSMTATGIATAQKSKNLINLRCTTHLAESQRRAFDRSNFSDSMFSPATKKEKTQMKSCLGRNLKRRCTAEYNAAFNVSEDIQDIKNKLTYAVDSIVSCYKGECGDECSKRSLVCSGKKDKKQWDHSDYLTNKREPLRISEHDEDLFRSVINIRLGKNAIESTRFKTNTQKTESLHRTYSMCNPQHVTFSRNFPASIHTAVHLDSHGIGTSTLMKLEAVSSPLKAHTSPVRALQKYEAKQNYHKKYKKSPEAVTRRSSSRKRLYALHAKKREDILYKKGMLDVQKKSIKSDHDYGTRASTSISEHAYAKK